MSLLDFTNKLLGVIKFAAEMAFDIMSPEAAVVQGKLPHPNIPRKDVEKIVHEIYHKNVPKSMTMSFI